MSAARQDVGTADETSAPATGSCTTAPPAVRELDLDEALVALGELLLTTPALEDYLARVAALAVQVLDPPASCGVSLLVDARPVTVASSGSLAREVESTQYAVDDGPCVHAMRTGERADLPDLAVDERWPAYRAHALALGLRSTYVVPLTSASGPVGALNMHARTRHAFDDEGRRRAIELFAAQTSAALELLRRDAEHRRVGQQLQEALVSRAVIDQAIGIVMATRGCGASAAFTFLRRTSQNANRKVRDVAGDLVAAVGSGASEVAPGSVGAASAATEPTSRPRGVPAAPTAGPRRTRDGAPRSDAPRR